MIEIFWEIAVSDKKLVIDYLSLSRRITMPFLRNVSTKIHRKEITVFNENILYIELDEVIENFTIL